MPSVKQSHMLILSLAAGFFALAGCESGDLARFAPPGIVKYEDLAGDQPPNPAVVERIEERRNEDGTGKFPILSQMPNENDRPEKRNSAEIDADLGDLVDAREALAEDVAADRSAAETDMEQDLTAQSELLRARIETDNAAAARERREKLGPLTKDE